LRVVLELVNSFLTGTINDLIKKRSIPIAYLIVNLVSKKSPFLIALTAGAILYGA
jgi:hypothetical protein